MKSLAVSFILGNLVLASCLSFGVASTEGFTLPKEMKEAVGKVIVNTTACSVTCGLGYKEEIVCEVGPDGVKRKCRSQFLECMTSWYCGMLHFTALRGKRFELSCLSADIVRIGHKSFRFIWRFARGIISIDDELFKPFLVTSHSLRFRSVREDHAGTYRCDVLILKNYRLVKRLYFGLRVLPPNLVSLHFNQSLTEEQKLMDEGLEVNLDNHSMAYLPSKNKVAGIMGTGIAIGVTGMLVIIVFCSCLRVAQLSYKHLKLALPALPAEGR
ncbi:transmembrane protein 81 [Talpa occidentalis]|uniref:transmembrane protein 81 n=1 Tax=Talpa occidentalis TaxID=50954 RepID=UPI00188E1A66|nr:transmembrane protein 81 [Talpa occidentalis]